MKLSTRILDRVAIVSVAGAVNSRTAGQLYDGLVERTHEGSSNLIVDLSDVHVMTRAGARGLVVAAKLMQSARGDMRICGAQPSIEGFLHKLGFHHLLKCDPTLEASLARLGHGAKGDAQAAVAPFRQPAPTRIPAPSAVLAV